MRFLVPLVSLVLVAAAPSPADLAATDARSAATAISIQTLTARIAANERQARVAERRLVPLAGDLESARRALATEQRGVSELLAALASLSRRPTALALTQPEQAATSARIGILLDAVVPQLRARTRTLRSRIADTERTSAAVIAERRRLDASRTAMLADIRRLTATGSALAARAASLRELMGAVAPPAPAVRIALQRPLSGRVMSRFGAKRPDGGSELGTTFAVAAAAQVLAPAAGRVAFAGPFRTYGDIVIIEHGGGVLTLLAGMAQISVMTGDAVTAGAAVGTMGSDDPRLYVEVRSGGRAVDPEPLFAAR
jgi:murein hydrolase activator